MPQAIPHIIPMKDLKNIAEISKMARETNKPIVVTRNGYADLVIQSIASYEERRIESEIAGAVLKSIEYIESGGETIPVAEAINRMEKNRGVKFI